MLSGARPHLDDVGGWPRDVELGFHPRDGPVPEDGLGLLLDSGGLAVQGPGDVLSLEGMGVAEDFLEDPETMSPLHYLGVVGLELEELLVRVSGSGSPGWGSLPPGWGSPPSGRGSLPGRGPLPGGPLDRSSSPGLLLLLVGRPEVESPLHQVGHLVDDSGLLSSPQRLSSAQDVGSLYSWTHDLHDVVRVVDGCSGLRSLRPPKGGGYRSSLVPYHGPVQRASVLPVRVWFLLGGDVPHPGVVEVAETPGHLSEKPAASPGRPEPSIVQHLPAMLVEVGEDRPR